MTNSSKTSDLRYSYFINTTLYDMNKIKRDKKVSHLGGLPVAAGEKTTTTW